MATIKTSPQAQGVPLRVVRAQNPTLSNHAQVAVWKYGADVCVAVYNTEDDGCLRGMQRDAARKAGMELRLYTNTVPALVSSTSVARKAITARAAVKSTITANERAALNAIIKSEYQDGDPVGHSVWTEYCNPFATKTTMSGVYASLVKKGLITIGQTDDMGTVAITQAGFDAMQAADAPAGYFRIKPKADIDIIGTAPAKVATPAPAPAAKRNSSTFSKEQLAVMREIAASARKHASK